MADITLSKAVRSNLLNLQATATQMGKTQERLATGLKVNSALDNPTNFFTASALNSRASDLGQLLDSVSNAVQTIAAADKGITAITKLVESAQATARLAAQTGATVETTTVSAQATITGGTTIAPDTTATLSGAALTGANPMDGVAATGTSLTIEVGGNPVTFDFYDGTAGAYAGTNIGIDVDTTGTPTSITTALADMQTGLRASGVAGTADATIGITGGNLQVTLGTNTTASIEVTANTAAGLGLAVSATADPANTTLGALTGSLTIAGNTLTFGAGSGQINTRAELTTALAGLSGGVTGAITGNNLVFTGTLGASFTVGGTLDVNTAFGIVEQTYSATTMTTTAPNPKREELRLQFNDMLGQIDDLAKDASFNGVNLLNGDDLSVLFNEDGTSKLDIAGVTFDAAGLGLTPLAATAFDTNLLVNGVLDDVKGTLEQLKTQASKFGSNLSVVETRQDFTKNMINVLETGGANLTLADTNEEAANLLALQTRQQLSSTALSLASQADQNVLRLFS